MWFDYACCSVPGIYINATEGGCLGAYPDGNIRQIIQLSLKEVVQMYSHQEHMREQCENPGIEISKESRIANRESRRVQTCLGYSVVNMSDVVTRS